MPSASTAKFWQAQALLFSAWTSLGKPLFRLAKRGFPRLVQTKNSGGFTYRNLVFEALVFIDTNDIPVFIDNQLDIIIVSRYFNLEFVSQSAIGIGQ